jgi:hypothetical protein
MRRPLGIDIEVLQHLLEYKRAAHKPVGRTRKYERMSEMMRKAWTFHAQLQKDGITRWVPGDVTIVFSVDGTDVWCLLPVIDEKTRRAGINEVVARMTIEYLKMQDRMFHLEDGKYWIDLNLTIYTYLKNGVHKPYRDGRVELVCKLRGEAGSERPL